MNREELLGYAAGYVDGDGCLTVATVDNGSSRSLRCIVEVACKHENPLRYLQGILGPGSVDQQKDGTFRLQYAYAEAARIAKRLSSYLYLKHKQAEHLVHLNSLISSPTFNQHDGMPPSVRMERESIWREVHRLNANPEPSPERAPRGKRRSFAYLAGVTDAEGCLLIKRKGDEFFSEIRIAMKDGFVCRWIVKTFGGYICGPYEGLWIWGADRKVAAGILAKIIPYLRAKHGQAEILVRLQRHKDLWVSRIHGGKLPASVIEKRSGWKERVHLLNQCAGAEAKSTQPMSASDGPICRDGKPAEPLFAASA